MAMSENGHASDGVNKTNGRNEPRRKSRSSFRWLFGAVVRYVYLPRCWRETWKLYEKSQLTVLLAFFFFFLQIVHLVCVAYTVLPLPVSIIGLE